MGMMKQQLADEEQKRSIAEDIAVESGAIKECELHPDTYIDQGDPSALELAYKIGNSRFSQGDEEVTGLFETRRALTDMIKEVVQESPDECYSCRKLDEE